MNRKEIEERLILLGIVGSQAHGINTVDSDIDIKGICIGRHDLYLGMKEFHQKDSDWLDEEGTGLYPCFDESKDICVYELRKFLHLAAECNPNIIELLWLDDYIHLSLVGEYLVSVREELLSTKVKFTFTGYGYSQIKRLERHRGWLLNPPSKRPELSDYGFSSSYKPLSKEEMGAFLEFLYRVVRDAIEYMEPAEELRQLLVGDIDYKGLFKQHPLPIELDSYIQTLTNASSDFIRLLHQTQTYNNDMNYWNAYQSWKVNRNPKRAALEKKCGYDSKAASQAIRLLTSGLELLREGELHVNRIGRDADLLLSIKVGDMNYEDLSTLTDDLFSQMDIAYKESTVRKSIDRERVNEICITAVRMAGL